MSDWSDAINDGFICAGCFVPFERRAPFGPAFCDGCARKQPAEPRRSAGGKSALPGHQRGFGGITRAGRYREPD